MSHLMSIVGDNAFGQIFITDTSKTRIPDLLRKESINFKSFLIIKGAIKND